MKIVKTIPKIDKNTTTLEKRKKEIISFLETGAKYGLIEYRTQKSADSERMAYKKAAREIGCEDLVTFYARSGQVFVERF